jgi:hypothetical protein
MSLSDVYWLKYPVATAALIAFLAVLGIPGYLVLRRLLPPWAAILAPNIGLAWTIVLVSWYARLGTALRWWVVWGAFALVVVGLVVAAVRSSLLGTLRAEYRGARIAASTAFSYATPWLLGITAVTIFMLPMIASPFQPKGFVTSFTFANADLGSYVGEATNVVKAGFADAGLYFDWNPGTNANTFGASTDHTGASALLALSSATLGAPVWKVGQVSIMLALAAMFAAATALVRSLLQRSPRGTLVIAALGTTSFMIWYLVGNFFLAHIVCLSMVLSQLAVIVAARDRLIDWRALFTLVPLAAATWLSSPELQFVLALLAAALIGGDLVASLVTGVPGAIRTATVRAVAVGLSVGIAALVIFPFTADLIARSKRLYASDSVVGWSLDLQNGVLTLLGYPDGIGTHSDLGWIAIAATGLLLLACLIWALMRRDRLGITSGVFGVVLVAACAYGAHRWGWVTYQSWKLVLSVSAPFLIFSAILVLRPLSPQNRRAALAVFAAIAVVNVGVGARMWDPVRGTPQAVAEHSVNIALVTVLRDPKVQKQGRLNMYVPTLYNTMIAPAIYGRKAAMSSPSYNSGGGAGAHPYSCSLVEASLYNRKMGKIVYTSHGYHLVATPRCS